MTTSVVDAAALVRDAQVARRIADEMQAAHYSPEDAAAAPEYVWQLAASLAGAPAPGLAVRVAVVTVLCLRTEKRRCRR